MTVRGPSRRLVLVGALACAATPILGALAACGPAAPAQARSSLGRVPATEPGTVPQQVAAFTARLAAAVRKDNENLVCSPWSVLVALAMVRNGAAGTTAKEMDTVFGVKDLNPFNQQLNTLQQAFATRNRTFPDKREVILESGNSLWGQQEYAFEKPFLDALAQYYGAGMNLVDFARTSEAVGMINSWTKDRTKGLIDSILSEDAVDPETRLILVNALYLKAPWQQEFNVERTQDRPFTPGAGEPVTVPMMFGATTLWHADDVGEATRIDYLGGELAMAVVRPKRDVATTLAAWAKGGLATMLRAWKPAAVELSMPKWQHECDASLEPVLSDLGMPRAFTDAAEFPGITKAEALTIAQVMHKARITVDEAGTEAAAATAVVMKPTSGRVESERHELVLDRPFLYVIHDVPTGTPLFLGVVDNPKS